MSLLKVEDLSLGYENDELVIKNLTFEINKNDFIIVVGSNGAGKSTLVKGILGLIKNKGGNVIYDEIKKNDVGYMPQELKLDQTFPASVYEIVLSGRLARLGFRPFYNKNDKEKANEALMLLNIDDLKNKNFNELSGGQRQKVLLARSLASEPKLLVLDEPSNNLDVKSKNEFYLHLKDLNIHHNISILLISHDKDIEANLGNKILKINEDYSYELINKEELK